MKPSHNERPKQTTPGWIQDRLNITGTCFLAGRLDTHSHSLSSSQSSCNTTRGGSGHVYFIINFINKTRSVGTRNPLGSQQSTSMTDQHPHEDTTALLSLAASSFVHSHRLYILLMVWMLAEEMHWGQFQGVAANTALGHLENLGTRNTNEGHIYRLDNWRQEITMATICKWVRRHSSSRLILVMASTPCFQLFYLTPHFFCLFAILPY